MNCKAKFINEVSIVIVNWNGYQDTIACLESITKLNNFSGPVVIVDNNSSDTSVNKIISWFVKKNFNFSVSKLINKSFFEVRKYSPKKNFNLSFNLVLARNNNGFAAGCNLGSRFSFKKFHSNYIWFLNNDSTLHLNAFFHLNNALLHKNFNGILGTTIAEFNNKNIIQSCGGRFNFVFGRSSHILEGKDIEVLRNLPEITFSTYPVGASFVVSKNFFKRYGFMREDLFLYYEEISWVLRQSRRPNIPIANRAIVFHKGSASTGFSKNLNLKNPYIDYYTIRNKIIIARQLGTHFYFLYSFLAIILLIKRLFTFRVKLIFFSTLGFVHGILGKAGNLDLKNK
jgi:GT2 family glycosyltransferase